MIATATASAAPFGYSVTLSEFRALLVQAHGIPRVADVFEFAAGALLAFTVLVLVVSCMKPRSEQLMEPDRRLYAGALNWLAVGVAIGATAVLATIQGWAAWPVSSLWEPFYIYLWLVLSLRL